MEKVDSGVKTPGIGKKFQEIIAERIKEGNRKNDPPEEIETAVRNLYHVLRLVKGISSNSVDPIGVRIAKINGLLEEENISFRVNIWTKQETKRRTLAIRICNVEEYNRIRGKTQKKEEKKILTNEDIYLLVMSKVLYLKYKNAPLVVAFEKLLSFVYKKLGKEPPETLKPAKELNNDDKRLITVILSKVMDELLYPLKKEKEWKDLLITQIDLRKIEKKDYKLVKQHMKEIGRFDALCKRLKEDDPRRVRDLVDILPSISPNEKSRFVYMKQFWNAMYELAG